MKKRLVSLLLAAIIAVSLLPMTAIAANGHASCSGSDCLVCDVADKINALPAASAITVDNAAAVLDQIHAIDRVKMDLTDDQYDELLTLVDQGDNGSGGGLGVPVRYLEAIDALNKLTGGGSLYITKKFTGDSGAVIDVTDAEVQLKITNLVSNAAQTLTMATLDASANFYSENADGSGWTYRYTLPAGTYRIEELGDKGATVNGKPFVTGQRIFDVDGRQSENSTIVTIENGQRSSISLYNSMSYNIKAVFEGVNVGGSKLKLKRLDGPEDYTFVDGGAPIEDIQPGKYEISVTAPEGYESKVTGLTFWADVSNAAGKDEAQGIAWALITENGEQNTFVFKITLEPIAPVTPLKIVEQPTDQLAMVGGEAIFSVKATGENLSYQWEVNNGNGWTRIPNGLRSTLRIGGFPIEADGQQFRCVITDAQGNTLTSAAATLHVKENAPIPETGDGMELFVFAGLAFVSMIGMAAMKKREQN